MGTTSPVPAKEDKHIYIPVPGITYADLMKKKKMKIDLNEEEIALIFTKEQIYAVQAKCPHAGGPLSQGDIEELPNKSACIKCPWHQWQFNLKTGECVFPGNRPKEKLHTYPVKITDDKIRIGFDKIAPEYFKNPPS